MNAFIHKSTDRGHVDHGWLKSHHSFSFGGYYDPNKMGFGTLRVLNDDHVEGGMGFGKHPHDNMEIISIPLSGSMEHEDSEGNKTIIRSGDVQVMSAGTGIFHSEKNASHNEPVKFLQIWIVPNQRMVKPRYDQITLVDTPKNIFYQVVSPSPEDEGVWIHQDVWFHLADFNSNTTLKYELKKPGNGIYAFVLEGNFNIAGHKLDRRDAIGITEAKSIEIEAQANSRVLLMEVPMKV